MAFTIEENYKPLYDGPYFEYVITENGIHYGVDRAEHRYDLYLLDEECWVVDDGDGRDTRNWGTFYQLGWKKDEMFEGIKKEWAPHLLPPYADLKPALIERYGEEYEGERIDEMDGDALDNLYKETFIEPVTEKDINNLELITKEKEKPMTENTGKMKLEEQQFNSLEELDQWVGDNPQAAKRTTFAHVKIPCAFVTPYTYTAKDGREYDKAYVSIPKGTNINGIDVGGYSCSVFMNDRMTQQHLDGEHVTLGFKSNEPISIWTGKKDSEQYPYKQFEVNPWNLVKAIKQQLHNYKEEKNQERDEAKKLHPSSLSSTANNARSASSALAQKNQDHPIVDLQRK